MQLLLCFTNVLTIVMVASAVIVTEQSQLGYRYPEPALLTVADSCIDVAAQLPSNQYYMQDAHGQYTYGYDALHSRKQEFRTLDGVTRGTYSYVDATGELQTVHYVADANGFRVAATNLPHADLLPLPQPVTETAEVAAARAQHLAAHEQIKLRNSALSSTDSSLQLQSKAQTYATEKVAALPQPVHDTIEVAAAKLEFFRRYKEEQERHRLLRQHEASKAPQRYVQFTEPSDNPIVFARNVQRVYLPPKL